ncbi:unnamed protein product [Phytophthora lilii]|uniref:Unnamed protein product n=1 Tax=Phytophthora lilii TaxID=2077276 RepID=A0A9W6TSL4_9STRA|nr:unnamed protein product [Phytophthora lilii]
MASEEEDEEYDFDYSDEDEDMEDAEAADLHVQIENAYYSAKQLLEGGAPRRREALAALQQVLALQTEQTDWGFKALKRTVKLLFELQRHDEAMRRYEELLGYTKTAQGTAAAVGAGAESWLTQTVSAELGDPAALLRDDARDAQGGQQRGATGTLNGSFRSRLTPRGCTEIVVQDQREAWELAVRDQRLLEAEQGEAHRTEEVTFVSDRYCFAVQIIKDLLASCSDEDADDGVRKNSQIQMYTAQKDNKKLVSIYEKALRTKSGVAHPVRKQAYTSMWDKARSDFFSGFKSYDEAGEPRRLQCLKYLVLANMLSESQVNVFDSQEAKPYENDKEVAAMTKLTDAFLHDEIKTFEQVLNRNQEAIMDDPFIKHYIDSLLRTIRSKVLLKIVKPYRTMDTQYIARELNGIPLEEVESLLSALVLDKKIEARIDQVHHTLVLLDRKPEEKFQTSIQGWCDALEKFHSLTVDRIGTGM